MLRGHVRPYPPHRGRVTHDSEEVGSHTTPLPSQNNFPNNREAKGTRFSKKAWRTAYSHCILRCFQGGLSTISLCELVEVSPMASWSWNGTTQACLVAVTTCLPRLLARDPRSPGQNPKDKERPLLDSKKFWAIEAWIKNNHSNFSKTRRYAGPRRTRTKAKKLSVGKCFISKFVCSMWINLNFWLIRVQKEKPISTWSSNLCI